MLQTEVTIHNISKEKVWEFYVNPKHIVNWNFAGDDWHCPKAEVDLKIGGRFSFRMEAKDGSFGFDFWGVYDEIIPQEKIRYTIGDGRKAEVRFTERNEDTAVEIDFEPEKTNPEDMQQQGWQAILNHFKEYAELQ